MINYYEVTHMSITLVIDLVYEAAVVAEAATTGPAMVAAMNFQVVVLAGGSSKKLFPLVTKDVPKALLPVGNRPLLSYTLDLLESNNLKNLIVVVAGTDAAVCIGGWISGAYDDRLHVEVVSVADEAGTADALRAVAHLLTADHVLVISGDLVCDVSLGAVAATHSRKKALMTALLCARSAPGVSDGGTGSSGKEKTKQQIPSDIIGLDQSREHLTFLASASQVDQKLHIKRAILRACDRMELHTDLVDAHLYAFKRALVQEVLERRPGIHSIKEELVPYLVRSQLMNQRLKTASIGEKENALEKNARTQLLRMTSSSELNCYAYVASKDRYCARVNSLQAFSDVNHDVAGEKAIHVTGYEVSKHNNVIHPTAELGHKSTVGPHCMLGEGSQMGDKSSIKRSVVGRHCRIGSGVKIMNSVVMNYVTLEDGCQVQGSIICSNVHLQERVILKDCQVGAGYTVTTGEYQTEALCKR